MTEIPISLASVVDKCNASIAERPAAGSDFEAYVSMASPELVLALVEAVSAARALAATLHHTAECPCGNEARALAAALSRFVSEQPPNGGRQ